MRVRIPTKLGFKNPKHVIGLVVLNNYTGGYWEDEGYNGLAAFESERPPPVTCERACPKTDVGDGSNSDLDTHQRKVRFAPINRNHQLGAARPLSANTGNTGRDVAA